MFVINPYAIILFLAKGNDLLAQKTDLTKTGKTMKILKREQK